MVGWRKRRRFSNTIILIKLIVLSIIICSGCWDYRGLNEQTIVAGIAVDVGEEAYGFKLTFEIVDTIGGAENGQFGSVILKTTGNTFAEAVHDVRAKLHNAVYLGVTDVVIVSQKVAEQGIAPLVEYFMRDGNARNSLRILVAGTETAGELFAPVAEANEEEGGGESGHGRMLSAALSESLVRNKRGADTVTDARACFEVYNILKTGTSDLVLPIVNMSEQEDIPFELDGLAIFTGDRMSGTLPEEDVPLYLLVTTRLRDWTFLIEVAGSDGEKQQVVIMSQGSRPRVDFSVRDDALGFFFDIRLRTDVIQLPTDWGAVDQAMIRRVEAGAGQYLSTQVTDFVRRTTEEGHDMFNLAETIRNRNPRRWEAIAENWRDFLKQSEVEVRVQVEVQNTGMLKG